MVPEMILYSLTDFLIFFIFNSESKSEQLGELAKNVFVSDLYEVSSKLSATDLNGTQHITDASSIKYRDIYQICSLN